MGVSDQPRGDQPLGRERPITALIPVVQSRGTEPGGSDLDVGGLGLTRGMLLGGGDRKVPLIRLKVSLHRVERVCPASCCGLKVVDHREH